MSRKIRLSASVDEDLLDAVDQAVKHGSADSVSAWVNEALRLKLTHDRRLEALAVFVSEYEQEHGEITAVEMHEATRRARARATPVRGRQGQRVAEKSVGSQWP